VLVCERVACSVRVCERVASHRQTSHFTLTTVSRMSRSTLTNGSFHTDKCVTNKPRDTNDDCVTNESFHIDECVLQDGQNAYDALSCTSLSAKEPLIIGLFCGK